MRMGGACGASSVALTRLASARHPLPPSRERVFEGRASFALSRAAGEGGDPLRSNGEGEGNEDCLPTYTPATVMPSTRRVGASVP